MGFSISEIRASKHCTVLEVGVAIGVCDPSRDRQKPEILEKKGWKIHRIWSVDWFKNREAEVGRLLGAVFDADELRRGDGDGGVAKTEVGGEEEL
jgi:very-short-patch-repair endonuclease